MASTASKRNSFFSVLLLFVMLSALVIFLSSQKWLFGSSFFENTLFPVEGFFFHTAQIPSSWFANKDIVTLQNENRVLTEKLVGMQKLQQDNVALRDQFQTTTISSTHLIPATVIGAPEFIPGLTAPEYLILNKGIQDGVRKGDVVVFENNLLGIVTKMTDTASEVTLVSNPNTSLTAKTSNTNAQGVLKGQGNGVMVFGSVLLSEKLEKGDVVLTNGSQQLSGQGVPPGLTIGKIVSVDKNPSSLYQSASVASLVNLSKLATVFVMQ